MDQIIDLYQQARAAQRRAEQAGSPNTAAALGGIAEMVAQEASRAGGVILPFALRAAAAPTSAQPIGAQARG